MPENSKLNPQVADLEIGIRNLRTIKIYPASFGEQLKLTDLITETVQKFFLSRDKSEVVQEKDMAMIQFFVELVRNNLGKIIGLVSDESEELLNELTNVQFVRLAELIYEMNYEESIKNVKSLFKKTQVVFQSKGQ